MDLTEPWTPYWKHIQEGWDRKEDPNLMFLFYEDMNKVSAKRPHSTASR